MPQSKLSSVSATGYARRGFDNVAQGCRPLGDRVTIVLKPGGRIRITSPATSSEGYSMKGGGIIRAPLYHGGVPLCGGGAEERS